ncbi:sigma-B regulation protein RsbU (phosphoserine phosphatase) [Rhodococcoides kroppenstedtii]|uniref:Sigma-B regulation protein RsbU (Phosphoserine phosphatase) n=1 Tax=Rhodococcoides kroppenstedtii TaxID=293050 RepID=A0A1I0U6V0_9NOCA|nr:GAF domain-containing SpoIIE family protein phosphatase [Rhodococcus kroppenstedtii]SFA59809.1 sigma-B regulation protein RsbU (phosphoserine phosphatase) [Rhodococcus kroppenstedtii]
MTALHDSPVDPPDLEVRSSTTPDPAAEVEAARLAAISRYDVLENPPDGAFDRIARLAARWMGTAFASVTIVDSDHIWFAARYGDGIPDRVPREDGLCSSAIAHDGVYVVPDARCHGPAAENSLVHGEAGIRFYAGAPIVTADGHRLGTVNVFDTIARDPADIADVDVLSDLAAVVVDELQLRLAAMTTVRDERARRARAESDTVQITDYAAVLQRTLLPPSLPRIHGLTLASHYHAVSPLQVGGDFYDVFALGDGRWAFFLGDVQGHGAGAASVTSLVRYTLRAAALHQPDPAEGLAELNQVLMLDPTQKRFCTVLFGIATPDPRGGFRITLATGGHPPALLLDPDTEDVHEIRSSTGMFVGALEKANFSACSFRLAPGQTLLLYTDGITEARPDGRTMFGEEGLVHFVRQRLGRPVDDVVEDLVDLIPGLRPIDDIALLALGA